MTVLVVLVVLVALVVLVVLVVLVSAVVIVVALVDDGFEVPDAAPSASFVVIPAPVSPSSSVTLISCNDWASAASFKDCASIFAESPKG